MMDVQDFIFQIRAFLYHNSILNVLLKVVSETKFQILLSIFKIALHFFKKMSVLKNASSCSKNICNGSKDRLNSVYLLKGWHQSFRV